MNEIGDCFRKVYILIYVQNKCNDEFFEYISVQRLKTCRRTLVEVQRRMGGNNPSLDRGLRVIPTRPTQIVLCCPRNAGLPSFSHCVLVVTPNLTTPWLCGSQAFIARLLFAPAMTSF